MNNDEDDSLVEDYETDETYENRFDLNDEDYNEH